ncbi:MAG: ribonuclease PH [Nitriliruptorales bacterium]|nr:ribonuclease PH [Nitriliruptorales bacterium]
MTVRSDGRSTTQLRPVSIETGVQEFAEGSALIAMGRTRVLCAASVEAFVPRWRAGSGLGWVTAEYAMLPRSTSERTARESARGRVSGRTHEIQRLIGRSLRSVVDLAGLGETSVQIDCDVLQADGGTRTAAITGAWVALSLALDHIVAQGLRAVRPRLDPLAAISVGLVAGVPMLDLCYAEDSTADVDMNVVMAGDGRFVELQGTAEGAPFSREQTDDLLDLAVAGCRELMDHQRRAAGRE